MSLEDDPFKIPRSPAQVGQRYALVVLAVGLVVGAPIVVSLDRSGDTFELGMRLAFSLLPVAAIAYAIGYFRQQRRQRKSSDVT